MKSTSTLELLASTLSYPVTHTSPWWPSVTACSSSIQAARVRDDSACRSQLHVSTLERTKVLPSSRPESSRDCEQFIDLISAVSLPIAGSSAAGVDSRRGSRDPGFVDVPHAS